MADDLVNVTIDGMQLSVPKGTSIIEAAKQAGVLVPHYCYHPSLPSPAVCLYGPPCSEWAHWFGCESDRG